MSNFQSLHQYFNHDKTFVVPYYQRGYKWSLQKNIKRGDLHIKHLLQDLKSEFWAATRDQQLIKNYEYYLQGITVKEDEEKKEIELVDGQQRTTSLFILFCAMQHKGHKPVFNLVNKLKYNVRPTANNTLQGFINGECEGDESIQDIAALKKAWHICLNELSEIENLKLFNEFIHKHIQIIYIKLNKGQDETKVFSMMNKDKADMSQADLVKSNILREASRQFYGEAESKQHDNGLEWQINQLRTKLASEWDNWRKWWENDNHKAFASMMGLTISSKLNEPAISILLNLLRSIQSPDNDKWTDAQLFHFFKNIIQDKEADIIEAIEVFGQLRTIQQSLQEWYNDVSIYNHLGLLFKGCGLNEKIKQKTIELLDAYQQDKKGFINTIKQEYSSQLFENQKKEENNTSEVVNTFINELLNDNDVYHTRYNDMARHLLRMNVMRINKQKQKFDFSLFDEHAMSNEELNDENSKRRSLEHIKPQKNEDTSYSEEELEAMEKLTNTVGNLVLIPKGLNSKLSNESFPRKKELLFAELNTSTNGKSYGLWLHTLLVFGANTRWGINEIKKNQDAFKTEYEEFFKTILS